MAFKKTEDLKRKNFLIPVSLCDTLAEIADEENTTETRVIQNAIRQYALARKLNQNLAGMKEFSSDSFAKSFADAMIDGLKREKLVVPAENLKNE